MSQTITEMKGTVYEMSHNRPRAYISSALRLRGLLQVSRHVRKHFGSRALVGSGKWRLRNTACGRRTGLYRHFNK